jgi:lipoate-protein ligase A
LSTCRDGRRVSELVEIEPVLQDRVPVVRRFSGGGTVIVDQETVFVTFICNKSAVTGLQPFPRDIMSWSGQLYGKVFDKFGEFHLRENGIEDQHIFSSFLNLFELLQ